MSEIVVVSEKDGENGRVIRAITNKEGQPIGYHSDASYFTVSTAPETKPSILSEAETLIRGDRAVQHGEASDTYRRVGMIWGAILGTGPIDTDKVLLMLAGMKLGRASISPIRDNYVDLAGYASLSYETKSGG